MNGTGAAWLSPEQDMTTSTEGLDEARCDEEDESTAWLDEAGGARVGAVWTLGGVDGRQR